MIASLYNVTVMLRKGWVKAASVLLQTLALVAPLRGPLA